VSDVLSKTAHIPANRLATAAKVDSLSDSRTALRASQHGAVLTSERLFGASNEIVIRHRQRDYRLRITAQGKLILTA
jgi:hemin uptake protein HemP